MGEPRSYPGPTGLDKQYLVNGSKNDTSNLLPQIQSTESLSDGNAFHKNQNYPVQKMESLIQSIVFLSKILYIVWA